MIGIVDYGAGNLRSVKKAFDYLELNACIVDKVEDFESISRLVMPGVGAFGYAMKRLEMSGFYDFVSRWIEDDRPFLGICLGMQMMLESSQESNDCKGLSKINGKCLKFYSGKIPQIGWNQVNVLKDDPMFTGIANNSMFYFVHSYFADLRNKDTVLGETEYGCVFTSVLKVNNSYGVQFHPEKSGESGLQLLKNWGTLC